MQRRRIANVAVAFAVDNGKPNSDSRKKVVKNCNNKKNNNINNKIKIYTSSSKTRLITILEATATVSVNVAVTLNVDSNAERDTSYNRFFTAIKLKCEQTQVATLVAEIVVVLIAILSTAPLSTLRRTSANQNSVIQ